MRIIACGDALFSSRNLLERLDKKIVRELLGADAVFVNAEFPCPKDSRPVEAQKWFLTAVSQDTLKEFSDLNMKLVSFANNHTGDFGWLGVADTIEAAKQHGLIPCGVGLSLEEARKAKFLDTAKGRIGVVATSATWANKFTASSAGAGIVPRPGLNPLRWKRSYVLPDKEFKELQHIDELLGTAASMREVSYVEVVPENDPDKFKFGSFFEGYLQIERGEQAHVRAYMDEKDCEEILKSVRDAAHRSDCVLLSIHTHEGINENWYDSQPPEFIEEFARKAIDAGASVIVGHGGHMLRGVEIYKGCPIFYNLGSILMEFEPGEQKMPPEMYENYGLPKDSMPSDLHMARVHDKEGNRIGFYSHPRFSQNAIAICDVEEGKIEFKLVPIDLNLASEKPLERGVPIIPTPEVGEEIVRSLEKLSERYGTKMKYNKDSGTITVIK